MSAKQQSGPGGAVWDGTLATWRSELLAYSRGCVAAMCLLGSLVYLGTGGTSWPLPLAAVAVGALALALPWLPVSLAQKSIVLVGASLALLGLLVLSLGWTPGYIGGFCVVLLVAGFLLGARASILVVVLSAGWFVAGGVAIGAGVLAIDASYIDPSIPVNWVRSTIAVAITAVLTFLLVRRASKLVGSSYARAEQGLLEQERRRDRARLAREARIAAVDILRTHQKIELVGRLSSGLAHWFNNALTVVRGATEGLTASSDLTARRQAATTVQSAIERGVVALKELMVFSRSDELALEPLDIGKTVAEFEEALRNAVGEDASLELRLSEGLHALADPSRLRQLLLNLVLNGNDATSPEQRIRVGLRADVSDSRSPHGYALITVEDEGHGMEPETLSRAVEPFFTTRHSGNHTGLGLSAASAIVEQFRGTLDIASAVNIGTRATARLPLDRAPEREVYEEPAEPLLLGGAALNAPVQSGTSPVFSETPAAGPGRPATSAPEWKAEMLRRLAYATAGCFGLAGVIALLVAPITRPTLVPMLPFFVGFPAVAGSLRGAPHTTRLALLLVPIAVLAAYMVHLYSFQAPAPPLLLLMVVAWATLLGNDAAGIVAVLWATCALGASGLLHDETYIVMAPIDIPLNWFRVIPVLVFPAAALAVSVAAVLRHARTGADILREAAARTHELAEAEAEEDRQLQIAEQRANRAARTAVAGQAVGTIAHDVRNALHALQFWSEEFAQEDQSEADADAALHTLGAAVDYAEALASQFSLAEAGVTAPHRSIDLTKVVKRTVGLLRALIPATTELSDDIEAECAARVGENDVRRLLFNLITNARDAISTGGTIRVSLKRTGERVELSVSDNGSGMADDTRRRVFDAFFTTKASGLGTGLGLHTVASIAHATAGTVELDSESGPGTTVMLSWPGAPPPPPARQLPAPDRLRKSLGTILVAEDEDVVREMLHTVLTRAGYRVRSAADGDQALELVAADVDYTAMCIDGVMPGRPTSEVVDAFMARHPGRPVLICSGYLPDELARRGLNRPGVSLLPKPFGPSRLREQLAIAIDAAASAGRAASEGEA